MVPFKNYFTGQDLPLSAPPRRKMCDAGGKHNDLDNVGYAARHHTFSKCSAIYRWRLFQEEAIDYALAVSDQRLEIRAINYWPRSMLKMIAFVLWRKIAGLPDDKIIRIATSDNFWSMGDTGPCGPCSEIFYDHGEDIAGGPPGSPDEDGDRFIEIWNLVFMQFEQQADGTRIDLPKPSIDTGMGLERISALLQGKHEITIPTLSII